MIQLLMAASLALLALARVPALRRNGKDTVFMAAVFAGAGSLLASPVVYLPVDTFFGGINLIKLILNSFMITGLWYLRNAVITAVSPAVMNKSPWSRWAPLLAGLAVQTVFFILTGAQPTTTTWGADLHTMLPAALFSMVFTAFIAYSCADIVRVCLQYIPRMRGSFRVGFTMVALGSVISVIAMVMMSIEILSDAVPALAGFSGAKKTPYHLIELGAIALVGIGLTLPAMAGRRNRRNTLASQQETIARVKPIRERVLQHAKLERLLQADEAATPGAQLHRMLVEIWDADLAAGAESSVLTAEERDYLLSVDPKIAAEVTR